MYTIQCKGVTESNSLKAFERAITIAATNEKSKMITGRGGIESVTRKNPRTDNTPTNMTHKIIATTLLENKLRWAETCQEVNLNALFNPRMTVATQASVSKDTMTAGTNLLSINFLVVYTGKGLQKNDKKDSQNC